MRCIVRLTLLELVVLLACAYGCDCGQLFRGQPSSKSAAAPSPESRPSPELRDTEQAQRWTFRRLGPEGLASGSTVFDVRSLLPRQAVQTLDVELHNGCLLELGVATGDRKTGATLHVSLLSSSGSVLKRFDQTIEEGLFWRNLSFPIETSEPVVALRLEAEPINGGKVMWSRPSELCPATGETKPPLNLILISLDTLSANRLGSWGNQDRLTPNLDRIAGEGTVFSNAYATYPNTLVSHASLFTGLYPHANRSDNDLKEPRLNPEIETLAERFASRGYVTGAITEDGFVGSAFGFKRGFDIYDDGDDKNDYPGFAEKTFGKALGWLQSHRKVPFFLFLHTYEVHTPYSVSPDVARRIATSLPGYRGRQFQRFASQDCSRYNAGTLRMDRQEVAWIEKLYDEESRRLDLFVGEFMNGLKKSGLDRNTLVVLFSDHGEEFSEHGFLGHGETLHRQALHVPLIFWAPGLIPQAGLIEEPVSLIDVGPTLAELAKVGPLFAHTPARSRVAWIMGKEKEPAPPPVFSELAFRRASCATDADLLDSCPYGAVSVRHDRYSYIHLSTSDTELLFDLEKDPGERNNLAGTRPVLLQRFREMVRSHREGTGPSPLIDGKSSQIDAHIKERLRTLGYIE